MDAVSILKDEGVSGQVVMAVEEVHFKDGDDVHILRRCGGCYVRVDDKTGVPIDGHKSNCPYA